VFIRCGSYEAKRWQSDDVPLAEEQPSLFQCPVESHLIFQLMNFIEKKNVPRLQHHQRPVNVFWGLEILCQLSVNFAGDFPCDGFAQQSFSRTRWTRYQQVRERLLFCRLASVMEIGVDCRPQNGDGSLLADGVI
jgi:hypothetical protein